VQLRLAMVKPDGTRIWFSRAKAFSGETTAKRSEKEFAKLAPGVAGNLISDAMDAMASPE